MDEAGVVAVGVDASPESEAALRFAFADAARRGARLHVVAAVPVAEYWGGWRGTAATYTGRWPSAPEDLLADARADTQRMVDKVIAANAGPPVPVVVEAKAGHPAQVLLDAARGADLLVLGHRGRGALASAVVGSVGLQCVLHAPCPVTIIRPRREPPDG
ncbi:universal stress protein [Pseudonocardia sp. RS11V-5]|uniref:universal stress protein n=1 Tax=Pseudonocardia terrae TaxID=2905831 RepID=UPI001E3C3F7D|nr:universal stress protein [Pseudonocardia terrae]MCE3555144.1 universal stress protein [Pseudonocardia terrae]